MFHKSFHSSSFQEELIRILGFWETKMMDSEYGGFLGRINFRNQVDRRAPKGLVLNARILWTFSSAAFFLKNKRYEECAQRAFHYLLDHFVDPAYGGMYWTLDFQGDPLETKKQVYAQAFAIYGLSEFYRLTNNPKALKMAMELFEVIEKYSFDPVKNGYLEAFDREWNLLEDLRLSDKDANEVKTMNTHLHLLEAYSNLYKICRNNRVRKQLENLVYLFLEHFLNPGNHQYFLFFDEDWNLRSDEVSYGHDIETAWLLQEAAESLGDEALIQQTSSLAVATASATLPFFAEDGGLLHTGTSEKVTNKEKHWWPQAEALVGFYNAFQVSGDKHFETQAISSWNYIQKHLIDHEFGEWVWGEDAKGQLLEEDKAGPWKCPYHNGRSMIEMARRSVS